MARELVRIAFLDESKIESLVRPLVEGSGFQLYDVEFVGRTLRVSIEKPGGVSITDCVETSRLLNPVLDVEDVVPGGRYELEVSSPGLDRGLRKLEHFQKAMGERIHVTTQNPMSLWNGEEAFFEKRRNLRGLLTAVSPSSFGMALTVVADGNRPVIIPLEAITRAYIDFEFKINPPPGQAANRKAKNGKK